MISTTPISHAIIMLAGATSPGQTPAGGAAPPGGSGSMDFMFIMVIIALAFYFLIMRPQSRDRRQKEQMVRTMAKGTKVVTTGGIHGVVVDVSDPDTFTVEIARNTRIKVDRGSIAVVNPGEKSGGDGKPAKESPGPIEKND